MQISIQLGKKLWLFRILSKPEIAHEKVGRLSPDFRLSNRPFVSIQYFAVRFE